MESIILIVHVLLAVGVIGLVLLQRGKGAEAGASFGGGASQTVFGSQGSSNFLTRTTAILATLFFVTSFALAVIAKQKAAVDGDVGIPDPALVEERMIEKINEQQTADELPELDAAGETGVDQVEDLPEINE